MSNRRGSILLETGLVLPVFGLLLLGGVDFGRMMVTQQTLVSAARAGVQPVVLAPGSFTEADIREAVERDSPGEAKRCRIERFADGGRRYLRLIVEADAKPMLGFPARSLRSETVVRLP